MSAEQYKQLIEEIGAPLAINSDEAVELQEPASALKNEDKTGACSNGSEAQTGQHHQVRALAKTKRYPGVPKATWPNTCGHSANRD